MAAVAHVATDVGNSAAKVVLRTGTPADPEPTDLEPAGEPLIESEPHQLTRAFSVDHPGWTQRLCRWVQRHCGPETSTVCWWLSTVNHAASDPLRETAEAELTTPSRTVKWHVARHQDVPLVLDVDAPGRVGMDRLLGAYAASARYPTPLVVVDAGSAVTVDLVERDQWGQTRFCGGAILPGLRLQRAALAIGTEGLRRSAGQTPRPEPETVTGQSPAPAPVDRLQPGRNTRQAVQVGILAAIAGAVDRLAEAYLQPQPQARSQESQEWVDVAGDEVSVVLTGGDAAAISPHLRCRHEIRPHLVCLGLLDLASWQCRHTAGGLK